MSSDHQRIKWRRNIAENFNPLSRVHERQTDNTTDGRTTTYSEREREFTFANDGGKYWKLLSIYNTIYETLGNTSHLEFRREGGVRPHAPPNFPVCQQAYRLR